MFRARSVMTTAALAAASAAASPAMSYKHDPGAAAPASDAPRDRVRRGVPEAWRMNGHGYLHPATLVARSTARTRARQTHPHKRGRR